MECEIDANLMMTIHSSLLYIHHNGCQCDKRAKLIFMWCSPVAEQWPSDRSGRVDLYCDLIAASPIASDLARKVLDPPKTCFLPTVTEWCIVYAGPPPRTRASGLANKLQHLHCDRLSAVNNAWRHMGGHNRFYYGKES